MSDKLFDLSGKTAIVTGASRGLGQYFGRALAKAGADPVITSRRLEALDTFKEEIESMGRKALPLQLDAGGRRYYHRIDPSPPRTKKMKTTWTSIAEKPLTEPQRSRRWVNASSGLFWR